MSPVRTGTALLSVAGALLLAGCSGAADADTRQADPAPTSTDATAPYADGTYTAEGSYQTPETVETISVTMTLSDDVVTAVEVVGDPVAPESIRFQGQFTAGIADVVVGKKLDELEVDRVAGSSLTSGGFDQAVVRIKDEAAAAAATE
ncbi:FMN-binding protein [Microbacterium sp. H1-D42]|uniref:FMN-binding protein n=1 Tax=Microbacterium sp. H1-D42 TaxID=2925844 RepID=UPI001F532AE2|nr:FMN-binding protein [Microbacterium sp. H1-D42]UNK71916.1 FMN-binding protein [Microbacterium sp. H1-D42]